MIPVYSSELNEEGGRGKALAQEFQSNIFGLNMAFAINLFITIALGKQNQWGKSRIAIVMTEANRCSMACTHHCYADLSSFAAYFHISSSRVTPVVYLAWPGRWGSRCHQ